MRKKMLSIGIASILLVLSNTPVFASDAVHSASLATQEGIQLESEDDLYYYDMLQEKKAKRITLVKYWVKVDKATIRTGPGSNYSSCGTLRKDATIYVKSISNGWAKFKFNGKWRYISKSCIKKVE